MARTRQRRSSSKSRKRPAARGRTRRKASRQARRPTVRWARRLVLAAFTALVVWTVWLDYRIVTAFEGRRWDLPARVFARPLELAAGLPVTADALETHLEELGYQALSGEEPRPGSFYRRDGSFRILTRAFPFWDGFREPVMAQVDIDRSVVSQLRDPDGQALGTLRLDPKALGTILPGVAEERVILTPEQVPDGLRAALIATEDRRFEAHHGVDLRAIARAARANVRAGRIEQGGSTLTQQLVKNYFLDSRRTLPRKIQEAVMALLLELHYSKEEILTAYANEVYLGQEGRRSIHGFGLGSQFYFGRPLADLDLHELALLAAVIRGPSWYNPWRHPDRARQRRDRVLEQMAATGAISVEDAQTAAARPLGLRSAGSGHSDYTPAFLALVRRQLARDYSASDLARAGLVVFTTLDPVAQRAAEQALDDGIRRLESQGRGTDLEGAVVVTHPHTGEVLAAVGGRRLRFDGFNRAIDARRPIGSLVKPFVYLTATETGRYSLASVVQDVPVTVRLDNGETWAPENFSGRTHGPVSMMRALAESMNLAAVNTGLDVGVDLVAHRLGELTGREGLAANPSLLLGAVDFTPLEVAELYGILATGGFHTPLRAVLEVSDPGGRALERYPLKVRSVARSSASDQVVQAMEQTFERGTARSADLPAGLRAAGKTGTTDGGRDSWFAGFTGDRLAVVWLGRDDNGETRLTGATGALGVWANVMTAMPVASLQPRSDPEAVTVHVDYGSGLLVRPGCGDDVAVRLPRRTELAVDPDCDPGRLSLMDRGKEWLKRWTR